MTTRGGTGIPQPRRRTLVATLLVATLASGCGTPGPSTTPPAASSTPAATPSPTPIPSPAYADTLTVGWNPGINGSDIPWAWFGFRDPKAGGAPALTVESAVYSALYRYDATFDVVPDLADRPCQPLGDGTVIRCYLIATTFQDGTPLTADDVAYSYELSLRPTFAGFATAGNLKEVRVVDPRTVDFVLPAVDPTFMTMVLPAVPILSKRAVETAYAAFVARTGGLKAADLTKLANTIDEEASRDPPVCGPRLGAVTTLLIKVGITLYREDFTVNGAFDACAYLVAASSILREGVAAVLGLKGLDAVAAAYALLSFTAPPVGTGPYRFVSEDAGRIHLEAWPGYHGGPAATRYLDFVPAKGDGSDLAAGTVDIYQGGANPDAAFRASAASHGLTVAALPQAGFVYLAFNVRPGRLFADINLRKALQLCIDLPGDVQAATAGTGTAIYGPVMPGTWAYDPTIPRPGRDPAAARALIEAAGWTIGTDGIYAKNGARLAAAIPVKSTDPQRVHVADLVALQARDCGMDLRGQPTKPDELFALFQYPHDLPGTKTPFDLFVGAWGNSPDPSDGFGDFASSNVTSAANADGTTYTNFVGFRDPTLDHLLAAAMSTYDQAQRASFYEQAQQELAAQLPYVFLWAADSYDVVRTAVSTVDGPLDLTTPDWAWRPERMVVTANS